MRSKTAFLVIILASVLAASGGAKAPMVAEKAPDFTLTDIDGNAFTLSDHRGKVVLIDFCWTRAGYCIQMQDVLKEVRNTFTEEDLVIISIFIGDEDTDDDIRDFRTLHGGNWTYAGDRQNLTESYRVYAIPTEFVVDVNGYIHYDNTGTTTAGKLSDEIEEAKTGYAPPEPEIPYALIALVLMVVVGVVSGTVVALLWRGRG
ncbi:MAG: TlpA disulfide reductase family protein [Thermoplasmata archaeon]